MAGLEVVIDCSLIVEAYNKGFEDGFLMGQDTPEIDTELNCNGIGTEDIEDKDDI